MQDIQEDICCMWAYTILLGKCCIYMPCSLNDKNNLTFQLL